MRNVVVSTLSEELFENVLDKLDEIGGGYYRKKIRPFISSIRDLCKTKLSTKL